MIVVKKRRWADSLEHIGMEFDLVDKGVEKPNEMTCRITSVARLENCSSEEEEESLMCSVGIGSELLTDLSYAVREDGTGRASKLSHDGNIDTWQ